jgi:hypothetical protein
LLHAFINEILIDTHCTLYNGWAHQGALSGSSRTFIHAGYLRQILDIASQFKLLTAAEIASSQRDLVLPQQEAQLTAHIQEGKWKQAAGIELMLAQHKPITLRSAELAACALVMDTLYALIREHEHSHSGYLCDAKRLDTHLKPLEQLRQAAPSSENIQVLLSRVYALGATRGMQDRPAPAGTGQPRGGRPQDDR